MVRQREGRRVVLARLGPGQVFGEMALILEKPRSAGVVALEDTVARRVSPEAFYRLLNANAKSVAPLMSTLFERLRTMDVRPNYEGPAASSTAAAARKTVSLTGLTAEAEAALGAAAGILELKSFPFKLGRKPESLFGSLVSRNDLCLADTQPYQVSRSHCAITKAADAERFFVQDRGSALGTIVNGNRLGGVLDSYEAELNRARNELVLGSDDSPFRFEIIIETSPA